MICVDSDCIIDFLKNKLEAVRAVDLWKDELVTTEVTRFEVLFGIFDKKQISQLELSTARAFFDRIDVFPLNTGCGEAAAELLARLRKRGEVIEQSDCLIAATALTAGCNKILTRNRKHFERIPGIEVVTY